MKILEDKSGMTAYEAAVYDITDPLVPIRGHGLIELTRLIDSKVLLRDERSRWMRYNAYI
jgi:hypothetical protein